MKTVYIDLNPQPKIDTRGYDHLHWTFQQDNQGKPEEQTKEVDFGTTFGCEEKSVGKWVFVGRGRSGYHYNLSPEYTPPYHVGDVIYETELVKDVNIQKMDNIYMWKITYGFDHLN
jgi:hypothetical protein